MSDDDPLGRLRKSIEAAAVKRHSEDSELAARADFPQSGDLFEPPIPGRVIQNWALLHAHPQQPTLWYSVPVDDHVLAGLTDVVVPAEARFGPRVLRCGNGLWLSPADLKPESRIGFLDAQYVTQARNLLAHFVRGQLVGNAASNETEADPDYDDWLAQVDRDRADLESWVDTQHPSLLVPNGHTTPQDSLPNSGDHADLAPQAETPCLNLSVSSAHPTAPAAMAIWLAQADSPSGLALAAAPTGKDAALLNALTGDRGGWLTVDLGEFGCLFLLCTSTEVRVYWFHAKGSPPELRTHATDSATESATKNAHWQTLPGTPVHMFTEAIPWIDNEVVFTVGSKPGRRVRVRS